jgi:hypothetical protein
MLNFLDALKVDQNRKLLRNKNNSISEGGGRNCKLQLLLHLNDNANYSK